MSYIKLSQLPVTTNITPDDRFVILDDPSGVPVTKTINLDSLLENIVLTSGFTTELAQDSIFLDNLTDSLVGYSGLSIVYDNDTNKIDFTITEVDGGNL